MEKIEYQESIILSELHIQNLPFSSGSHQTPANQRQSAKNVSNKDRLRKLSGKNFIEEIKLLEKRFNSNATNKTHLVSEVQLSNDESFRSVKQKLQQKQDLKHKHLSQKLLQSWELQDLGYMTFKIVRQRPTHGDAMNEQNREKQMGKPASSRTKTTGH